jgi:PST family polysaccharide transporter/lipopolysaccharide exporter
MAGRALLWRVVQFVGVQAIFLVRLPILARLLLPEDFGLLTIAVTAVGFLLNVTELGMAPALVQGQDVNERQYHVAWTVGILRASAICGTILLAAPLLGQLFGEPRATPVLRALAFRPLLDALASVKTAQLNRDLSFRPLAVMALAGALASTSVSIALAAVLGVWALVAGDLAKSLSLLVASYLVSSYRPHLLLDPSSLGPLVRFGRWVFLTGVLVMAGGYVLRVVISRRLGVADLGLYYLGGQIGFLPAEVAGQIIGTVAFPLFSRLQGDPRRASRVFRALFAGTSALLLPACVLVIALAPALVNTILGPRWVGTASVIRVLALVSLVGTLGEVTAPVLKGFGQPYRIFAIEAVQSLLIGSLSWWLAGRYGLLGAALAWLPAVALSQVLSVIFVRRILWQPFAGLGAVMLTIAVATGIGALAALTGVRLVPGFVGFALATTLGVLVTGALLWVADRRFALGLLDSLRQVYPQIGRWSGRSVLGQ